MIRILLVSVLSLLAFTACSHSKPTRVLLIGGAGLSQLGDLNALLSATCADADIIETGGWDGFRADAAHIATDAPAPNGVILIGHSFGCKTAADAAAELSSVDLLVLIDPAWDEIVVPRTVRSAVWFERSEDGGLEARSIVHNAGRPIIIPGDHNHICHDPELMAEVTRMVRKISDRRGLRSRLRHGIAAPAP
jgi:pimeloyl-ACP methyl ester carboxylesterase